MPATPADIITSASMTKGLVPPIEAKDLSKYFIRDKKPIAALDAISLRIASGQITGLIGPDGAGKTTFMRLCAGLRAQGVFHSLSRIRFASFANRL